MASPALGVLFCPDGLIGFLAFEGMNKLDYLALVLQLLYIVVDFYARRN